MNRALAQPAQSAQAAHQAPTAQPAHRAHRLHATQMAQMAQTADVANEANPANVAEATQQGASAPSAVVMGAPIDHASPATDALRSGEDALALAWALKEQCYACWSSEPQRAAQAAHALAQLGLHASILQAPAHQARELRAVADWTQAIAHITEGQMAAAVAALDGAAAGFAALGQDLRSAQTQVAKIMALSMLGQFDAAAACAENAQRELLRLGDTRAASKVSLNLGSLNLRQGNSAAAVQHYRKAAVLFGRVGDHELSIMADIGIGDALSCQGELDDALRILARARMRAASHGFPVLEAKVDESEALLQLSRGRYREALACFEHARQRHEELGLPQNLAIDEKQLADAYLELRLLPEALAQFKRALLTFETLDMPDDQAWAWLQCGRTQALQGHVQDAQASLGRAATLFATHGVAVGQASVSLARADLALHQGQARGALGWAQEATAGFVATGLVEGRLRAQTVSALALLELGETSAALALLNSTEAHAVDRQLLGVQERCLSGRGLAALALSDNAAAAQAFNAAIELFEAQRSALPDDELRCAFLSGHGLPYEALLRMALQAHAADPSAARAGAVLHALDRSRARALGERLQHRDGVNADGSPAGAPSQNGAPQDNTHTQHLRERLNWLYRRVQRLDDEGASSAALGAEARRLEFELLEAARRNRLAADASPAPGPTHPAPDAFSLAALTQALGPQGALVEYGVSDEQLFACVVTQQGVQVHAPLAPWSQVQEALRSALFQIEALRHGSQPMQAHLATLGNRAQRRLAQLHALIWAPLAPSLVGLKQVLVVPHGQLGLLPFSALHDGQGHLAERLELAVVSSARLALRGLARQACKPQRVLAMAETSRLSHTAQEAQAVAALFDEAQCFTGAQATLEQLRAHAPQADILHLACHGQFRGDNPLFSALQLQDGALTVEQAQALRLRPGIVVLSACETGLAQQGKGDEMVGLVRAFMVAGSARVVASLWPVDDATTACFMTHFYSALRADAGPAAALAQAQQALRRTHPHPASWAAFTLFGGW